MEAFGSAPASGAYGEPQPGASGLRDVGGSAVSGMMGGSAAAAGMMWDPRQNASGPPPDEPPPPPDEPHATLLIQSQQGELQKQSDGDTAVFEDFIFRLSEIGADMSLEYWSQKMPNQSVTLEARCITKIYKGFDKSQHDHTMGAIGLQLDYCLFPSLRSRQKHLRIRFSSLEARSQWIGYLVEGTGLTPEDPHDHLHRSLTNAASLPANTRPTYTQPGFDSSDEEHQTSTRRPGRKGWNDDDSSDGGDVGVAYGEQGASSVATPSQAWWKDKQQPPWELDDSHAQTPARWTTAANPEPVDLGNVRSEVTSMQLHRASRSVARQTRPDGLAGGAQFNRMQTLDSRLIDLRREREQRMGHRQATTMPEARGRDTLSSMTRPRSTEQAPGRVTASSDYNVEGAESNLSQDLQITRARRAELESKLATMRANRASRSTRKSATAGASSMMMEGEGSTRVRAKRLHISLSSEPEHGRTSVPTTVLFDPTISIGAFDRLLRCVSTPSAFGRPLSKAYRL